MSASLVGSEMCIRDRPPGTQPATSGTPRPGNSQPRRGPTSCRACARGCLLYTSDAADDMQV
eukprot:5243765-Alexandrium_andersonii.AAC.1